MIIKAQATKNINKLDLIKIKLFMAEGMAQVVESLCVKHKALS
jgi:hypothetical protein